MNPDLKNFVEKYLAVVLGTYMSVYVVAFFTLPYILSHNAW